MFLPDSIFKISGEDDFLRISLEVFRYQSQKIPLYKKYIELIGTRPEEVSKLEEIPFLPIEFFKSEKILKQDNPNDYSEESFEMIFSSSGTTGSVTSKHYVYSLSLYERSFSEGFNYFYGDIKDYVLVALLPSYLERDGSSLIYMVQKLIEEGGNPDSGFYLHNLEALYQKLIQLKEKGQKTILMGVTYALLDFIEKFENLNFPDLIIMETGGMKGKRKEIIREELHTLLNKGFKTQKIHSEYGMTELLSQSYSLGEGRFTSPPWMKILIRETTDPFSFYPPNRSGGINVIDLANLYSCSFLATQDLGKLHEDGSFEILGRFDHSDVRGCNLLVE